jgi:hypothetical protein
MSPNRQAAHVNDLIARAAEAALGAPPGRCAIWAAGWAGTLFHLAARWPAPQLTGLTLSAEQARMAGARRHARGLDGRVQVLRSDFTPAHHLAARRSGAGDRKPCPRPQRRRLPARGARASGPGGCADRGMTCCRTVANALDRRGRA